MQTQLEATLAKLISIPSVTSDALACNEVIQYVRSELEALGLFITSSAETSNPWLIATIRETKTPEVVLAAHLDVVPATPEQFIMRKSSGRLYGRGVYDMKMAAACYIEFIKAHIHELQDHNLGLLFTTDEETTSISMQEALATGLRPKVVLLPDGGYNWSVEQRAKGVYNVELIARGKTAHGSRPWEGENAIHMLFDVVHTLRSKYPSKKPTDSTLSLNFAQGGKTANQIPDRASIMIDFRTFSKKDYDNYRLLISELAKKHDLEIKPASQGEPLHLDTHLPAVQDFLRALEEFLGEPPRFSDSYGASDARFLAQYGVPSILIQPNGGGHHSETEWIEADDLLRYYEMIQHWLLPNSLVQSKKNVTVSAVSA